MDEELGVLKNPHDDKAIQFWLEQLDKAHQRAQGLAMKFGKGRVIILGEAAMLSAQITGPNGMRFGMNLPGIDNRQLALNIMHWLSGLLK